jgi:hypothetical protein
MKQKIMIGALCLFALISCQKSIDSYKAVDDVEEFQKVFAKTNLNSEEKELLLDLKKYSRNFKLKHASKFDPKVIQAPNINWRRFFRVAGADILGATGGAVVGGFMLGGPGAIFGAIVSGTGASVEASQTLSQPRAPVEIDNDNIDTLVFRYNPNNGYDSVGVWHNGGLDILTREEYNSGLRYSREQIYQFTNNYASLQVNDVNIQNQQAVTTEIRNQVIDSNAVLAFLNSSTELQISDTSTLFPLI